jgi:anaerobic magnesium-protoporphyrin IX monomethyl ester cyclase
MKNVLLINPPQSFERKGTSEGLALPLGLLYLKAMIPECNTTVLDLSVAENPKRTFLEKLESKDWDVIGITVLTYSLDTIRQLVKLIKKHDNPYLVGGGPHATLAPNDCIKMGFDAVVIGEGEQIISDLVQNKPRGILHGNAIHNLDEIPFPDRSTVDNTIPGLATNIVTSRGCPFNCAFCGRIIRGSVRRRSVASVMNELKELKKQGFENIFISDDYFITNKRWVTTFCNALKTEKMRFNFFYQTRIDNFDQESAKILRETGTQYISFGIESIHPNILKFYNKTSKPTKWRELTEKALGYCNDTGIYSQASLIIGAPMETEDMFWESYDFVRESGADTINVNPLMYMVGSEIWKDAVKRGIIKNTEYLIAANKRKLCPIPPDRIDEICSEVFEKVTSNYRHVLFKTLRHLDRFRIKLISIGIKKFISWNLLGGDWRKHYDIIKEFGYGKTFLEKPEKEDEVQS